MRQSIKFGIVAAALVAPTIGQATGIYQCEPMAAENWISKSELTDKLTAEGWTVSRSKKDGGCWEVYGKMPDGKRVEAYFHPQTGEVRLINQRGTILFRADD